MMEIFMQRPLPAAPTTPWIAGANTLLSRVGDQLKITTNAAAHPRAYQLIPSGLYVPGTKHIRTRCNALDTNPNQGTGFFRISNTVAIPDGDIYQQQINGAPILVDTDFVVPAGDFYIGFVVLCTNVGDNGYTDFNFVIS